MLRKLYGFIGIFVFLLFTSFLKVHDNFVSPLPKKYKNILDDKKAEFWADSVLQTLSLEEKIGQLIMIDAHPQKRP